MGEGESLSGSSDSGLRISSRVGHMIDRFWAYFSNSNNSTVPDIV